MTVQLKSSCLQLPEMDLFAEYSTQEWTITLADPFNFKGFKEGDQFYIKPDFDYDPGEANTLHLSFKRKHFGYVPNYNVSRLKDLHKTGTKVFVVAVVKGFTRIGIQKSPKVTVKLPESPISEIDL